MNDVSACVCMTVTAAPADAAMEETAGDDTENGVDAEPMQTGQRPIESTQWTVTAGTVKEVHLLPVNVLGCSCMHTSGRFASVWQAVLSAPQMLVDNVGASLMLLLQLCSLRNEACLSAHSFSQHRAVYSRSRS